MSEQEFELYLKLLSRCLGLTSQQREQIADELRDHFEERLEELARAGVPREKAVFQALDEFGDAAVLAAHFTTIAHLKRRRILMRLSLGSVAVLAAALLIVFAFWPQNRAVQGPPTLLAQSKTPGKTSEKTAGAKTSRSPAHAAAAAKIASPVAPEHPLSSDVGQNPKIEAALEATVNATFDPQPLKEALDWIAFFYQIPIVIDRNALDDAGVKASTEVRVFVTGLKLRQTLTLLLHQLPQPVGFDIRDGVLRITTEEKIRQHRYVVVYDCRDLVDLRSMSPAAGVSHNVQASPPGAGAGGGMFQVSSTPALKTGPSTAPDESAEPAKTPCGNSENPLIRVIRYAGTIDDWEDGDARITELGGMLVVNQNPIVHEQIKRILGDLRRMKKEGAFATLEKEHSAAPAIPPAETPRPGL